MPERPRLQVLEAVNSSSHVNLRNRRWCQEFHRYGHKVAWGRQKAPRSFGGWWGRREWTMSWSSSSTASLPSPVACSSINTSRSWGWPLDVIATRTRKRHSQFTGLSISLWPTSLFLGCWTLHSRILVQGGRPIQANHRPWYWQTHGRRKRKHWRIWNSGKTDLWTLLSSPKSSKVKAGKVVVEVGGLAEWEEVHNFTKTVKFQYFWHSQRFNLGSQRLPTSFLSMPWLSTRSSWTRSERKRWEFNQLFFFKTKTFVEHRLILQARLEQENTNPITFEWLVRICFMKSSSPKSFFPPGAKQYIELPDQVVPLWSTLVWQVLLQVSPYCLQWQKEKHFIFLVLAGIETIIWCGRVW